MTDKKCNKFWKNVNILECHDHIWNHREKYIIGTFIREIDVKNSEIWESEQTLTQ